MLLRNGKKSRIILSKGLMLLMKKQKDQERKLFKVIKLVCITGISKFSFLKC